MSNSNNRNNKQSDKNLTSNYPRKEKRVKGKQFSQKKRGRFTEFFLK